MSAVTVTFDCHWSNGWWQRALAEPYLELDGEVTRCAWDEPMTLPAEPGPHMLRTFMRYRRGSGADHASHSVEIPVGRNEDTVVTVRSGPLNTSPFIARVHEPE